jgi:tetratricopeptide (TPR) repeat protein
LICPHCRFETLSFPCSQCGWEEVQAYTWAAREAEKAGKEEKAAGLWRQAIRAFPSDHALQRSLGSCLSRLSLKTDSNKYFVEAASVLSAALHSGMDWEEGHQLRILLHERFGQLEELQRVYETQGESGKRWAEVVRLVRRFRDEKQTAKKTAMSDYSGNWWTRLFLLALGLTVTFWGSLWYKKSIETNHVLFGPVFLTVFGLALAAGSALLHWKPKKKTMESKEGPHTL